MCYALIGFSSGYHTHTLTLSQGWNTWNSFHEEIEEKMVRESAEILISSGLAAAGRSTCPFLSELMRAN